MRIVFIGCVQFSYSALSHLLDQPHAEVVAVVTKNSSMNSDFCSLQQLAETSGVPVLLADAAEAPDTATWIRDLTPDVIYCFGWSELLSASVLSAAPLGAIGFHPAALPYNRGRHPLIWALALGLERTSSTFFMMDESADTGDIVSQVPVTIDPQDDARCLYDKVTETGLRQISEITKTLAVGRLRRTPQPAGAGSFWRKRRKADGCIDWRMSGTAIHNLVRALARPYDGAHCIFEGREVKVWRTEVVAFHQHNIEPGKVLNAHPDSTLLVKCEGGAIRLLDHGFGRLPDEGSYL
ncbi:methionyl-tRNA formyltransferase [Pelagibius sp.]|uniref:methionyl-tRNA formyltransferase n=1 Tax=Pelagibius sp. TaxID=1931238 RepID=UPI003B512439